MYFHVVFILELMFAILLFTLNTIMPVILLMVLGYLLRRINFLTAEFLKIGNKTVFFVLLPLLLFKNIADINDISQIRMDVIGYVLILIAILFAIGFFMALTVHDPKQKGVIHQCIFRSNFALIGVPLGLLVAFIKMVMIKNGVPNPLTKVTFPYTIVSYLARAATPVSLLVLGGQFDMQRMSGYKKQLIIGVTGRNLIAPLLGVGGAVLLTLTGYANFGPDVFAALIALFGTPVAVASAIMAEAMDNDGQLAGQLVVWTTILSLVTLFVIIFIVRALGLL